MHLKFVATKSTRDGEWGDHVTLQAAADLVNKMFPHFLSC